jgi:UDP-N-acetylbacillosamine N-acetyltransferase
MVRSAKLMKASGALVIFGAGGHGRVAADCGEAMKGAGRARWKEIVFLDPEHSNMARSGLWTIRGVDEAIAEFDAETNDCFVGIGDNSLRKKIQEKIAARGYRFATLVHPDTSIGSSVQLGVGTLVMPRAVVNFGAAVQDGCIINTAAVVEHDCRVNAWVHLGPSSVLGGGVTIGEETLIGLGAKVMPNLTVCDHVTIGAGATVTRSIKQAGTYAGTPARRMKN